MAKIKCTNFSSAKNICENFPIYGIHVCFAGQIRHGNETTEAWDLGLSIGSKPGNETQ